MKDCEEFVTYRNESSFGHGALRSNAACEQDLQDWLPMLRELLNGVERLADWRLCLVTSSDCCSVWMGTERGAVTEAGAFAEDLCGHFVLRRSAEVAATSTRQEVTDLFPFLCYLPDREQQHRLHFYESIRNYREVRKEVDVLEYDNGFRCVSAVPIAGLERLFTADLLAKAAKRQQGRMEIIEGRVAGFGELIVEHANIVGRKFVINAVKQFIEEHDRGLLVIEAEPGKGKTALMCHLIEEVFGHYAPQPIRFFYRRTAGITDPDVCVRTIYDELLKTHELSESDDDKKKSSHEEMMKKLTDLLSGTIASKLSPSRPQLILIDGLDEAETTSSGKDAFQRIPESLPEGVYVIVTTRHIQRRTRLARRSHVHWYDLDSPDLLQNNLRDGAEFVRRELKDCRVPNETVKEIARIGAGNFLALKLLVNHVRGSGDPGSVDDLLRRIATEPANEHLRFIFEEFWERLTGRMEPHEIQILCDVAGLLVTARWPLSAEMICECLRLSSAVWDFALRQLVEYLTVIEGIELEEQGERESFYRVYHESFAEFLRAKVSHDRRRLENVLADYCRHWNEHAQGRGRLYSLRFAPEHLLHAAEHDPRRWNQLEELLTDIFFLEAKAQVGFVYELIADFSSAWQALPSDRRNRVIFKLLEEVVRREASFISQHSKDYPQALFQCVWNLAWWYGNPKAAPYYFYEGQQTAPDGKIMEVDDPRPPGCEEVGDSLCRLLERWRCERESEEPGFVWIRSQRPPAIHLGTDQIAVFRLFGDNIHGVGFSSDGTQIIVGCGSSVRRFEATTGRENLRVAEWDASIQSLTAFAVSASRNLAV